MSVKRIGLERGPIAAHNAMDAVLIIRGPLSATAQVLPKLGPL